jgi:hypothetical protein
MATPKLSQTERIKRFLLKKGVDYPTDKVVSELKQQGCEVNQQLVYNVRSVMKQAQKTHGELPTKIEGGYTPRAKNDTPLSEHVLAVLTENYAAKKGFLPVNEITKAVIKGGFNTNAQNFTHLVRMECERLKSRNKVVRHEHNGSVFYGPVVAETPADPEPVAEPLPIPDAVVPATVVEEVPPVEGKSVQPEVCTSLGIDSVNISDLLAVQRLVKQIGGSAKLQQHVKLLEDLEKKPATELLETFATRLGSPVTTS